MLITGHASTSALKKYLRDIEAELPDDYSSLLKRQQYHKEYFCGFSNKNIINCKRLRKQNHI